jgi:hypothetical protein
LQPGDVFWIDHPDGWAGVHDGEALLSAPDGYKEDFCPLYVRQLGEGRVVCIQWLATAKATPPFGENDIYFRSVNWAAKRPVGESWIQE